MILVTPRVSRTKSMWYKTPKSQEIGIKFKIKNSSNFDKQCSDGHFVSFLSYYYRTKDCFSKACNSLKKFKENNNKTKCAKINL